jgi:hypothetical protein
MKKPWVSLANSKRKGKLHPLFGTKRSKATRKKISKSRKGKVIPKESSIRGGLNRSGNKHHAWNGGVSITKDGYRSIRSNLNHLCGVKKYILEHRLVVEKEICRKLLPTEDVHHIDGNRTNNNITNLMAFSSRSAHKRYEMGGRFKKSEIIFDGGKLCS